MLAQVVQLLAGTLVGFFTLTCLIRFFMQVYHLSFTGQPGRFIVQFTNWLIRPLRRVVPSIRHMDTSSLVAAYLSECLGLTAVVLSSGASWLDVLPLGGIVVFILWRALMGLLRMVVYLFIGALVFQAILSWVNPHSPLYRPLTHFTDPLLRPVRRLLPPIGGLDLSPLVLILAAQLLLLFL